jgi:beta-glucosidase
MRRTVFCAALVAAATGAALGPPTAPAAGRCGDPAARPWCDTSKTPEQRARLVLAQMTLDEKIELMAGDDLDGVVTSDPATGTGNGIPRLGIPVLYHSDGPVGPREGQATAMPGPLSLAATFDPSLARRVGDAIANEVKHKGNDLVHAPTVEPMRTPLAGRTFETYGEDPLLSARIAVDWIKGAQAQGIIANVKHFAPNSQEGEQGAPPLTGGNGSRFLIDAIVDERTLREIYFPAFEAAVKEGRTGSLMCAYGSLNGHFACESSYLLTQVLRKEWGFDGVVISDYGFAMKSTAASAIAGTDIEMPIGGWYSNAALNLAVASGQIGEETVIDERVGAILRMMFRFGLFDRDAYPEDDTLIDKPGHANVAREVEQQGTVLLRNRDAALPLASGAIKSLAVIGEQATAYKGGGGSSNVQPFAFKAPLDAIKERAGAGVQVRHDPGTDPAVAAATALGADAAIVFVADAATEGSDKPCLALRCAAIDPVGGTPLGTLGRDDPDLLIDAVAAANKRTIVVMETGGPVLTPWADRVDAVLEAWYPGQEAGLALASVLFGDADPGGRLPVTFPVREGDIPTAGNPRQYPGVGTRVEHSEGVFIGYRHYDQRKIVPRWPFGHGLSYTSFSLSGLRLEPAADATVSVVVKNTGARAGTAVPQAYLGMPDPSGDVKQPPRALKGFAKLTLAAGASKRVSFPLDERAFSYWDTGAKGWRVKAGCYSVQVGFSSRDLPVSGIIGRGADCEGALVLPTSRRSCTGKRIVTIRLPRKMRSAKVTYGRRSAKVVRRKGRLTARLDLRRLAGRKVTVRVRGRSSKGKALRQTRVIRTCPRKS